MGHRVSTKQALRLTSSVAEVRILPLLRAASSSILFLLVFLHQPTSSVAMVGGDGRCPLFVFAPFTEDGKQIEGFLPYSNISLGFSHMAAALLATQHFNARDTNIIPELAELEGCNVQLEITKVFDTGYTSHQSARQVMNHLLLAVDSNTSSPLGPNGEQREVCSFVGPSNDIPARDLSSIAYASDIPLVSTWREGIVRDSGGRDMMTASVYPDLMEFAAIISSYLIFQERTDYVAILYPFSDLGFQKRGSIGVMLDFNNVRWISTEYVVDYDESTLLQNVGAAGGLLEARTIRRAVERIKEAGYRTVLIIMEDSDLMLTQIADAVEEMGMNSGDHFFMLYDPVSEDELTLSTNVSKLLEGACYVLPLSRDMTASAPFDDAVLKSWGQQDKNFPRKLNELNPINENEPGFMFAQDDFFQNITIQEWPEYGSAFMYDAVLAVGFGACQARREADGSVQGIPHIRAIRKTKFHGWSGFVLFGREALNRGGVRRGGTVNWTVVNFIPGSISVPHVYFPTDPVNFDFSNITWSKNGYFEYFYAGNRSSAPLPLRTPGNQNYLRSQLRAIGLTLMGISILAAICFGVWVFATRTHRIVRASQPSFLYVICIGTILQSSTVVTISFDEGAGWSENGLTKLCNFLPWLFTVGFVVVVGALYVKVWRVHKTLQFSRRKVQLSHIAAPMALLVLATIVILAFQSAFAPLEWQRDVDEITADSNGGCSSSGADIKTWLIPLMAVAMTAVGLLAYAAHKTRDVDEAYSESSWIFGLLCVQFELILISIPIILRLHETNSNSTYLVLVVLILSFPVSCLGLLFGPKMHAYYDDILGIDRTKKRGTLAGVRVTGVQASENPTPVSGTSDFISQASENRQ
mmetsp:Transcript_37639/g.78097  ORF Transcript_37639/g.78097 Transcript_37639/m.78097 type:complete len:866 (-) Transcript_37639:1504-4101(-)